MKKLNLSQLSSLSRKEKIIVQSIMVFFLVLFSFYSYNCFSEKVCGVDTINKIVRSNVTITMPKGVLVAEVVDTKNSRELGLSRRDVMHDDEGMLFIFEVPGRYGFWMKDMKFPLDVIWINKDGVVVHMESNFTPESYLQNPPKTSINGPEATYVLEINGGKAEGFGLFLGSKVKISE